MSGNDEKEPFPVNGHNEHAQKRKHIGMPSDMLCGLGPWKPGILQGCVRMGCFAGVYSSCGLMTSILSMYIVSQITTIEKQFGFSSAQSGFLLSCNDIGFLLTTMFFSYIARKVHIPRTLWLCTVLYGFAGLLCSVSYFISKDHVEEQTKLLFELTDLPELEGVNTSGKVLLAPPSQGTQMCKISEDVGNPGYSRPAVNISQCDAGKSFGVGEPNQYSQTAMVLIAIGMMIQGLAKAPRYPFLTTYVDDNVEKKDTAMYMGIMSGVGIFGPAIAFSVGGLFSKQYVTLQDVPINPRHPAWIGAWWLGFIVFGFCSIAISFPLILFPRRMRPKRRHHHQQASSRRSGLSETVLGFLKSLLRLITNTVYMPLVIGNCFLLFSVAGILAFMAKYLEAQFFVPAWKANILIGVMNILSASAGTMVGGIIVSKRKLSPLSCLKMILVVMVLAMIQNGFGFILGCSNADIVGYNLNSPTYNNASCLESCDCDVSKYFPVCGSDNVNYMSPCHAGCQTKKGLEFQECLCIDEGNGTSLPGLCETGCQILYPYLISNILGAFLGTLNMMPIFIVTIRSVSEADKSMAVGFSSLLTTLCGWFAGPVVFGILIDTTCRIWNTSCSGTGACALYDNDDLRFKKHTYEILPKVVAFLLYIFVFFKSRHKTDWSLDHPEDVDVDVGKAMLKGDNVEMTDTRSDRHSKPIFKGGKHIGRN